MTEQSTAKPVTTIGNNDISNLMNPGTERRQPMQGFDPDYVDIVDYIVRCTHKIWEEGAVGLIYTHRPSRVLLTLRVTEAGGKYRKPPAFGVHKKFTPPTRLLLISALHSCNDLCININYRGHEHVKSKIRRSQRTDRRKEV